MKKLAHEEEKKATLVRNKAAAAAKAKKGKEKEIEEAEFDDEDEDEDADEEGDDSSEGITRCVCGEDSKFLGRFSVLFILLPFYFGYAPRNSAMLFRFKFILVGGGS